MTKTPPWWPPGDEPVISDEELAKLAQTRVLTQHEVDLLRADEKRTHRKAVAVAIAEHPENWKADRRASLYASQLVSVPRIDEVLGKAGGLSKSQQQRGRAPKQKPLDDYIIRNCLNMVTRDAWHALRQVNEVLPDGDLEVWLETEGKHTGCLSWRFDPNGNDIKGKPLRPRLGRPLKYSSFEAKFSRLKRKR